MIARKRKNWTLKLSRSKEKQFLKRSRTSTNEPPSRNGHFSTTVSNVFIPRLSAQKPFIYCSVPRVFILQRSNSISRSLRTKSTFLKQTIVQTSYKQTYDYGDVLTEFYSQTKALVANGSSTGKTMLCICSPKRNIHLLLSWERNADLFLLHRKKRLEAGLDEGYTGKSHE